MERKKIIDAIIAKLKQYSPIKIAVFGSFARGDDTPESDIDILVDFNKRVTFLELVGIEIELSELIGKKVELISERAINPKIKKYIENDLQIIYQWRNIPTYIYKEN